MTSKPMTLQEIARRINAHLKRFEADAAINIVTPGSIRRFYNVGAGRSGNRVWVTYVSFQGGAGLKKADAMRYLAWLDAGNVGCHYEGLRKAT